jgi:CubicO group peptidase (beta-lactamase class C family)
VTQPAKFVFASLLSFFLSLPIAVDAGQTFSAGRLTRIDERMQEAVADGLMVGGQGVIAHGGEVVYHSVWGQADRERGKPMTPGTLYRIYSMTKPVTSVALLMLYEEGHFLLNDPVERYLPEFATLEVMAPGGTSATAPSRPPTIRDLLRHTAGMTYGVFGNSAVDRLYRESGLLKAEDVATFTRTLATLPLQYNPGERWHYSVAVDVQGRLVEVLSGMSLGEFLRRRIFEPLGMRDTHFRLPRDKQSRLAQLYSPRGASAGNDGVWVRNDATQLEVADAELSRPYLEGGLFESGGAGLVSSAQDYLRFALMLLNEGELEGARLLAPATVRLMRSDHLGGINRDGLWGMGAFGLGVGIVTDPADKPGELLAAGSYGWGGAAGTDFWVDPENDVVGVFMVQSIPHQTELARRFRVLTYQALVNSAD